MLRLRLGVLIAMVAAAAVTRLLPHPPDFTPLGAMALFGGACFASRSTALAVPLAALFVSDLLIGLLALNLSVAFQAVTLAVYGSFALIVCMGFWLRNRRRLAPIAVAVLASSVLFFVLKNFGVWALGSTYSKTTEGLVVCYDAAMPFFLTSLLGDILFSAVLFGGLAIMERSKFAIAVPVPALERDGVRG